MLRTIANIGYRLDGKMDFSKLRILTLPSVYILRGCKHIVTLSH